MLRRLLVAILLMLPGVAVAQVEFNHVGRATHLIDFPASTPMWFDVWVVPSWEKPLQQWQLREPRWSDGTDGSRILNAHYEHDGRRIDFRQTIRVDSDRPTHVTYRLTAQHDIDLVGVFFFTGLDTHAFRTLTLGPTTLRLPRSLGESSLASTTIDSFEVRGDTQRVLLRTPSTRHWTIQDARQWNDPSYNVFTPLHEGRLARGQVVEFSVDVEGSIDLPVEPATLVDDGTSPSHPFDGIGGNFVFSIESPVTQAMLDTLPLAWGRIGAELIEWEPTNDNADAASIDRDFFARRASTEKLRKRFAFDPQIMRQSNGRLILSAWHAPVWLTREGGTEQRWDVTYTIAPDKLDELAECVTSYLLHLKSIGVEPAMFSFNESDIGIRVKFDPQEMRQLILTLGRSFERAGLKTKLLLGDSASLRIGLEQIAPTLADPEAMRYVAALAYHPWNGENDLWDDWADIAQRTGLPLLATELGADPQGYHDGSFNDPMPSLRHARRTLQQLRDARTRSLLEWEWTGDYAALRERDGSLEPTYRYGVLWLLSHATTQSNQRTRAIGPERPDLLAAMIESDDSIAIHVLNVSSERPLRLTTPHASRLVEAWAITPTSPSPTQQELRRVEGGVEVTAPAGAFVTFTSRSLAENWRADSARLTR